MSKQKRSSGRGPWARCGRCSALTPALAVALLLGTLLGVAADTPPSLARGHIGVASGGSKADHVVHLPLLLRQRPRFLFADDFESGIGAWTAFLNLRPLRPEQWFWAEGEGVGGSDAYMVDSGLGVGHSEDGAHDVLTMVLAEGSDQWADYSARVRFNITGGRQAGIWFRGNYRESDEYGHRVTGYYLLVDVRSDEAYLNQLRTEADHGDERNPHWWYHYTSPMQLTMTGLPTKIDRNEWHELRVDVVGARIRGYLDDQLVIDWVDDEGETFLTGTIGLYGYGNCTDGNCAEIRFDDVRVEPIY